MKKIRVMTCLLAAALVASTFTGCGESEVKTVDAPRQQEQGQKAPQNDRGTMAKVVSLDSDQLTVILADMPSGNRGGGTPPAISTGAAIEETDVPAGTPGQPGQPRQGGGEIEFTGEEATYTLSSDVTITKGIGDAAAEIDLSELAADDVIRFKTITDDGGNEAIQSIVVME